MARGSVRRAVHIRRPADEVWGVIGDPARIHEWFPGIVDSVVEGSNRTVTTGAGIPMPEEILTDDQVQRRFQYRITAPIVQEHLSTLDVHDLGDGTTLAVYSADADPNTMALIIAGAAGNALESVRDRLEGAHS